MLDYLQQRQQSIKWIKCFILMSFGLLSSAHLVNDQTMRNILGNPSSESESNESEIIEPNQAIQPKNDADDKDIHLCRDMECNTQGCHVLKGDDEYELITKQDTIFEVWYSKNIKNDRIVAVKFVDGNEYVYDWNEYLANSCFIGGIQAGCNVENHKLTEPFDGLDFIWHTDQMHVIGIYPTSAKEQMIENRLKYIMNCVSEADNEYWTAYEPLAARVYKPMQCLDIFQKYKHMKSIPDLSRALNGCTIDIPSAKSKIVKKYQLMKKLGAGAFGVVWKAVDVANPGDYIAIKLTTKGDPHGVGLNEAVVTMIMSDFEHSVKCIGSVTNPKYLIEQEAKDAGLSEKQFGNQLYQVIALELYQDGDVESLCQKFEMQKLQRPTKHNARRMVKDFMQQIGEIGQVLFNKGLIHRDIKAGNVLVRKKDEWSYDYFLADYDNVLHKKTAKTALKECHLQLEFRYPYHSRYTRHDYSLVYSFPGSNRSLMDVHMLLPWNDKYHGDFTKAQYGLKFEASLESDMIFDITMTAIRLFAALTKSQKMKQLYQYFWYFLGADYDKNARRVIEVEQEFIGLVDDLSDAMRKDKGPHFGPKSVEEVIICMLEQEVGQVRFVDEAETGMVTFAQFLLLLNDFEEDNDYTNAELDEVLYPNEF